MADRGAARRRGGWSAALVALALVGCSGPTEVKDAARVTVKGQTIALTGILPPGSACDAARAADDRARARLAELIGAATKVEAKKDSALCLWFMTCTGAVTADGVDVAKQLVSDGFVDAANVPRPTDWCATPG